MVSKPAPQAILSFAVACVQLYKRLCVGSIVGCYATLLPKAYMCVVLGRQRFEYIGGTLNKQLVLPMAAIGMQHRHHGINDEDVNGSGRQMFGTIAALITEGVMCPPIFGSLRSQYFAYVVYILTRGDVGQFGTSRTIELGQLRQSDVREVLRTQT